MRLRLGSFPLRLLISSYLAALGLTLTKAIIFQGQHLKMVQTLPERKIFCSSHLLEFEGRISEKF